MNPPRDREQERYGERTLAKVEYALAAVVASDYWAAAEGELEDVRDELRTAHNALSVARDMTHAAIEDDE